MKLAARKQTIPYHITILLLKLILEGIRKKHGMVEVGPALNKGAETGGFQRSLSTQIIPQF